MTSMTDTLTISTQGDAAWDRLTLDERARIYEWHRAITSLPASATVTQRIDILARLPWVSSRAQARTKYYAWHTGRYAGTWRALADGNVFRRAVVKTDGIHSRRFGDWGRSELDVSQRSEDVALDAIIAQIWAGRTAAGEPIPGLEDHPGGYLPAGCSKPNLRRILRRSKAERAAAQWGHRTASHLYLPFVRTTRRGMEPGQAYMFDDVWHDLYVHDLTGRDVRILEFGAHDVASGCRYHWGWMPQLLKNDGSKRGLTREMFVAFLAASLRNHGYHRDGVLLMMEHGTATISEEMARKLYDYSGGLIRVGMGGMTGGANKLLGGWAGRGAGEPHYKSMIECLHSLIHHIVGMLPAASGRDRRVPETTQGMLAYGEQLHRWLAKHPEMAERVTYGTLNMAQFGELLRDVYTIINNRRDHQLEGWSANGWTYREMLTAEGWQPERLLADSAAYEQVRVARMSPAEVWAAYQPRMTRLPMDAYAMLIDAPDRRRELTARRGEILVHDRASSDEPYVYDAEYIDPHGVRRALGHGAKVEVLINPYDRTHVILLDARGRILGESAQRYAPRRLDVDAVHQAMGRVAAMRDHALSDMRVRNTYRRTQADDLRDHNRALADEAAGKAESTLTPVDKAAVTRAAKRSEIDVFEGLGELPAAPVAASASLPEPTDDAGIGLDDIIF